jgi:hypothetical protein
MRPNHLRRREFITLFGVAATWPLAARSASVRARRISPCERDAETRRPGIINQIRAFLLERGVAVRQGLRSVLELMPCCGTVPVPVPILQRESV